MQGKADDCISGWVIAHVLRMRWAGDRESINNNNKKSALVRVDSVESTRVILNRFPVSTVNHLPPLPLVRLLRLTDSTQSTAFQTATGPPPASVSDARCVLNVLVRACTCLYMCVYDACMCVYASLPLGLGCIDS